jgi:hypothetical protein
MNIFVMRGYGPSEVNVYDCRYCKSAGREHQVIERWAGFSETRENSGAPIHMRHCTGCGFEDGPWVKAEHHYSGGLV